MIRRTLILGLVLLAATPTRAADSYIKVQVKGTLRTGIVAIGGETTGTEVQTKDGTVELDLAGAKGLRDRAERLNGKTALVKGELTIRRGVEKPQRLIVRVASLEPVEGDR